jgi:hypothetical protein
MKTIHKYPLNVGAVKTEMPAGARVLSVQVQKDIPCLWAEVDTDNPSVYRSFLILGTGHQVPTGDVEYLGTFQLYGGDFVGHVYEVG